MNKIIIIGRLCADPELKTIPSGAAVCNFRVAVNRRYNRQETDFFNVNVWKEAAENCNKYLRKGSQVCVSGALQMRQYEQDGVKRLAVEIQAEEVEFLSAKSDAGDFTPSTPTKAVPKVNELQEVEDFGDMPF